MTPRADTRWKAVGERLDELRPFGRHQHHFVEGPADDLDARSAEQLLGAQVPLGDLPGCRERHHGIEGMLDDQAGALLARSEGAFGTATFGAAFGLAQFALDGGDQPRQVALHQVVVGAETHRLDGDLFADRARHQQAGQVAAVLSDDLHGLEARKPRQRVIDDDQVPSPAKQRATDAAGILDPQDVGSESAAFEFPLHQPRIVARVLDEQQPDRSRRHAAQAIAGAAWRYVTEERPLRAESRTDGGHGCA